MWWLDIAKAPRVIASQLRVWYGDDVTLVQTSDWIDYMLDVNMHVKFAYEQKLDRKKYVIYGHE
jgi:hypothetical protein